MRPMPLLLLLAPTALWAAVPEELPVQGTLYDASGTPVDGTLLVTFGLYAERVGGDAVWSETRAVGFDAGAFAVQLGEDTPLAAELFAADSALFLGVQVAGDPLELPRFPLGMTPYAAYAERAADADFLEGFRADDFASAAHTHDFATLAGVPPDLADGDADTQLTEAEVDAHVANNGYLTSVGWDDVGGKPSEVTDLAALYADVTTLQADLVAVDALESDLADALARIEALEAGGGGGGGVYTAYLDGSGGVAQESPAGWIASSSASATPTIGFAPGVFTTAPICVCTGFGSVSPWGTNVNTCGITSAPSTSEVALRVASSGNSVSQWWDSWTGAFLVCFD